MAAVHAFVLLAAFAFIIRCILANCAMVSNGDAYRAQVQQQARCHCSAVPSLFAIAFRHERELGNQKEREASWGGCDEQSIWDVKPAPGTDPGSCSRRCSERFHADAYMQRPFRWGGRLHCDIDIDLATFHPNDLSEVAAAQRSRLACSGLRNAHWWLNVTSLPARAETDVWCAGVARAR